MNEVIIKRKNRFYLKNLLFTPLTLYFIGAAIMHNVNNGGQYKVLFIVFLSIFGLILTAIMANSLMQMLKKTPALVIDKNGLTDLMSFKDGATISWSNIKSCELTKYAGVPHLIVKVSDHNDIISAQTGFAKKILESKVNDLGTPVALNCRLFDYDPIKLKGLIDDKIRKN